MSSSFRLGALAALLAFAGHTGAVAQTTASPTAPSASSPPGSQAASAPAGKGQSGSRAKTPPGKPPGGGACSHGSKAQRQRCLNDMYGPGAPRL